MNLDRAVAVTATAIYAVAVVALLPSERFVHMLGGGALFFGSVAALAYRLRTRTPAGFSILLVSFAGAAILLVPNFPAMGGQHPGGISVGFLGSQAGALLWISQRWEAEPNARQRASLAASLLVAVLSAIGISLVASVPIGLGVLSGREGSLTMLWVYPAYFVGALASGMLYWLLQGIAHRPVGRYLIGALAGFCVYAAIGPVVSIVQEQPLTLREIATMGVVAGCLVGPPVAMAWSDNLSA